MTDKNTETLRAYDDIQTKEATTYRPENLEELKKLVTTFAAKSEKLVGRGAGHSFDGHALEGAVVYLSADAFQSIGDIKELEANLAHIEVGAGVTWGTLLEHVEKRGWIPFSVVTSSNATVGGTLAAHCLSRFSGVFGKEGDHVVWFELVAADGKMRRYHRNASPDSDEGLVFRAVIGGFGLLGIITHVCVKLGRLSGDSSVPVRVESTVDFYGPHRAWSWNDLLLDLRATCVESRDRWHEAGATSTPTMDTVRTAFTTVWFMRSWRALFSTAVPLQPRAALIRSRYVRTSELDALAVHRPEDPARPGFELAMLNRSVNEFVQEVFMMSSDGRRFEDNLHGFTFFFDGNTTARRLAREYLGAPVLLRQQTFILPGVESAVKFIEQIETEIAHSPYGPPTLMDILWLPKDDCEFMLSSTRDGEGFAISLAYEHFDLGLVPGEREKWLTFSEQLFRKLAGACVRHGGRVHLIKTVLAHPADIKDGIGAASLEQFFAQKEKLDPKGVFESDFLRNVLRPALGAQRAHSPFESLPSFEAAAPHSVAWENISEARAQLFRSRLEELFGKGKLASDYHAPTLTLTVTWTAIPAAMPEVTFRAVLQRLLDHAQAVAPTG